MDKNAKTVTANGDKRKLINTIDNTRVHYENINIINQDKNATLSSLTNENEIRDEFREIFAKLRKKYRHSQDLTFRGKLMERAGMVSSLFTFGPKKSVEAEQEMCECGQMIPARGECGQMIPARGKDRNNSVNRAGEISLECLIGWARNLDQASDGITHRFRSIIDDQNMIRLLKLEKEKRYFISEEEFLTMILSYYRKWSTATEKKAILWTLATSLTYADEVEYWPPFFFVLAKVIYDVGALSMSILLGNPQPNFCSTWILNPFRSMEPWRYFTYSLLHASWGHLVKNMILLLLVGIPLELEHAWWRVGLVYLVGVWAGSLLHHLLSPSVFLLGSSSGVYAVITAYLLTGVINWKEDDLILTQKFTESRTTIAVRTRYVKMIRIVAVAFCLFLDFTVSLYHRPWNCAGGNCAGGICSWVTYVALAAGVSAGVLGAVVWLNNRRRRMWEVYASKVIVALIISFYFIAVIICYFGHDWFPDHFPAAAELAWYETKDCCHRKVQEFCCHNPPLYPSYCLNQTYQFGKQDIACYNTVNCPKINISALIWQ